MPQLQRLGIPELPLLPVTSKWALPITIYYMTLSFRVGLQRMKTWTVMGDRTPGSADVLSDPLYTAIRAQANFLEYVPLSLTLAVIAELNGASGRVLDWCLGGLLACRVLHVELGLWWKGTQGYGRHVGYWWVLFFLLSRYSCLMIVWLILF
jgi:uncharacterized membrane protein YecN with MAPEG domain